jgi:bla regulator protein BlaR1
MNAVLEQFVLISNRFADLGMTMLIQSSLLIILVLSADRLLRGRVPAASRYWLWIPVLGALVVPIQPLMHVGENYLPAVESALAASGSHPTADVAGLAQPGGIAASVVPVRLLTWQAVVFVAWIVVAAAIAVLLFWRTIKMARVIATAKDANGFMQDTLRYCCKCLGIRQKVGFKVSIHVRRPFVWGLLNPVIVIPHDLAPTLGARHVRAVLLHELTHIKRGDLWVNLAQTILHVIYFYNPLVWLANWVIRRVREQATNEMVIEAVGYRSPWYSRTLADVANLRSRPPVLSVGLMTVEESRGHWTGPPAVDGGRVLGPSLRLSA